MRSNTISGKKTLEKVKIVGNFDTNNGKVNGLDLADNLVLLDENKVLEGKDEDGLI